MIATRSQKSYGPYPWGFHSNHSSLRLRPRLSWRLRRPFELENLEPRLLLSADALLPGVTSSLETGLVTFGDKLDGLVTADSTVFDTPIPGLLQTTHDVSGPTTPGVPDGTVDDKDVHVPELQDTLALNVDRNADGVISPFPAGVTVDKCDLKDVYRLVNGEKFFLGFIPFHPSAEQALSAMYLNDDTTVDFSEIYDVLVAGATSDFLADYSAFLATIDNLEADLRDFLSALAAPSAVSNLIALDLSSVSANS